MDTFRDRFRYRHNKMLLYAYGNQTGLVKILIIFKFMLQWWCEGALFSGVGVIGLVVNVLSVGILSTKELRKHTFNQVLNI